MRQATRIIGELSVCFVLSLAATVAAAWTCALLVRLNDNDVVAHVVVRSPSLPSTDAWDYSLHRAVGATCEFAMIVTDVPDSELAAPSENARVPSVLMTRALGITRFTQPKVDHGGFLCLDTRGLPLRALYSTWEYGDDGVKVLAGLPVRIQPPPVDDVFQPLDVIILPTRVRLFGFLVDLVVWTFIFWKVWRKIRLTKRFSQPLAVPTTSSL